ncbi:hypothetical protein NP493_817g02061 [Ridgeia piscesae]|uniref:Uncharacterized protein n=1 Tax=Ridgeia piscesae TaxID=27915 RepID=A0AAD9NL18_RIDPI|nr:hypothetical protein NP493_817g02061 [Ridgeia piscesae]
MISHQKKKFEGNDVIKKIITDQMFHHHNSNVRRQMYDWLKSDSLSSDVPNSIDHSQEDKENGEAEKEKTDETTADANEINSTGDSLPEPEPMEA